MNNNMNNNLDTTICELCGLKYTSDMIVDKKYSDFTQCYDCLFFMNFNNNDILKGSMGYNLTQYLEVSTKYHMKKQEIPCHRLNDTGGCYVCMSLLDIPFDDPNKITDVSIIKKNESNNTGQLSNMDIFKDIKFENELNVSENIDILLSI